MKRLRRFFKFLWCRTGFELEAGKPVRLSLKQAWWRSGLVGLPSPAGAERRKRAW